jgi:hypothetical protein
MWDGSNNAITTLPIANIQLPRLDQVGANIGAPADLSVTSSASPNLVPVPVLPASC